MVGNDYTDKLICMGYAERESEKGGNNDDFNYFYRAASYADAV